MEEPKEPTIYYKIVAGRKYRVFKNTVNDVNYYKICISQKNYDGTTERFYKDIRFKKGVDIKNESDIIINEAYENYRRNPKDKYNGISYLNITNFTLCETEEQQREQAYSDYQDTLNENENGSSITDADLPF